MTFSWKNFFFASFDPGGYISVDKPPVFLWVDALSARIFGYHQWSLTLPQVLEGVAVLHLREERAAEYRADSTAVADVMRRLQAGS